MTNTLTSDPSITEAYNDVRNDKTETDWLILTYQTTDSPSKNDVLKCELTGKGGLEEMIKNLPQDNPAYGYLRMTVANDDLSERAKFALILWIPETTKPMRKAKVSVQSADVKKVLPVYAIEVNASTEEDLEEKTIRDLFTKAMGAKY